MRAAAMAARFRLGRPRALLASTVQLVGLGAIVGGVAMLSTPAALIVAGIGAVLWSQGVQK